ncbi:MAG TPA: hypothetical protein VK668_12230 [Mucilaginibacter sp.]|nr:hypothetical protein [Mucilaginibacter sp.]
MKNYNTYFICNIFLIIVLINTSFKSENNRSVETAKKDVIFKNWLCDTLRIHRNSHSRYSGGLINSSFLVGSDSLSLSIVKTFHLSFPTSVNVAKDIKNVKSLLKNYDELPKGKYTVNFQTKMYYFPSEIRQFKYNYEFEIDRLQIIFDNSMTDYNYIRGRLSGKSIKSTNPASSKKQLFEFFWQGKTLKKIAL